MVSCTHMCFTQCIISLGSICSFEFIFRLNCLLFSKIIVEYIKNKPIKKCALCDLCRNRCTSYSNCDVSDEFLYHLYKKNSSWYIYRFSYVHFGVHFYVHFDITPRDPDITLRASGPKEV